VVAGQDVSGESLPHDLGLGRRLGADAVQIGKGGHDHEGGGQQQLQHGGERDAAWAALGHEREGHGDRHGSSFLAPDLNSVQVG
jgi:hypothetical protein